MYAIDYDNPWIRLVAKDRARAWVVVLIAAVFAALVLIAFRFLGSTIAAHIEAAVGGGRTLARHRRPGSATGHGFRAVAVLRDYRWND